MVVHWAEVPRTQGGVHASSPGSRDTGEKGDTEGAGEESR